MVNAQKWLDEKYPSKEERKERTRLDFSSSYLHANNLLDKSEKLEGDLDLRDFVNLKKLYCFDNKLTSINVSNLINLNRIFCYNNQLTRLEIGYLSNLEDLRCSENYLTDINLLLSGLDPG